MLLALALVAVPLASAAPTTTPALVGGTVKGFFYGGSKALQAKVGIVDPSAPNLYFAEQDTVDGMFGMLTALPLTPPTYSDEFTAKVESVTGTGGHNWISLFTAANESQGFNLTLDTANAYGYATIAFHVHVLDTTVSGTVKSAKTTKALKGVKVTIGNQTVATSKKGKFSIVIGLWPASKYKMVLAWKGHKKVTKTFTSAPGTSITPFANIVLK